MSDMRGRLTSFSIGDIEINPDSIHNITLHTTGDGMESMRVVSQEEDGMETMRRAIRDIQEQERLLREARERRMLEQPQMFRSLADRWRATNEANFTMNERPRATSNDGFVVRSRHIDGNGFMQNTSPTITFQGRALPPFRDEDLVLRDVKRVMSEMGMHGLAQKDLFGVDMSLSKTRGESMITINIDWDMPVDRRNEGVYSLIWTNQPGVRFFYMDENEHNLYFFSEYDGVAVIPLIDSDIEMRTMRPNMRGSEYIKVMTDKVMDTITLVNDEKVSYEFQAALALGFKHLLNNRELKKEYFKEIPKKLL